MEIIGLNETAPNDRTSPNTPHVRKRLAQITPLGLALPPLLRENRCGGLPQ